MTSYKKKNSIKKTFLANESQLIINNQIKSKLFKCHLGLLKVDYTKNIMFFLGTKYIVYNLYFILFLTLL